MRWTASPSSSNAARFTAVMGPSGSGKSTLMHCMAGLDAPTAGRAFIGAQELGRLDDAGLTGLRRDRVGFVFQSFNLVPTLTAAENITLPADLAGARVDRAWFDQLVGAARYRRPARPPPARAVRWPAAARRLRAGARLPPRADLRRRADRQPRLERLGGVARVPARGGDEHGQAIVMVTHDPQAAAYADRVVFLADGRVVGRAASPSADAVLEQMKRLGGYECAGSRSAGCSRASCGWR